MKREAKRPRRPEKRGGELTAERGQTYCKAAPAAVSPTFHQQKPDDETGKDLNSLPMISGNSPSYQGFRVCARPSRVLRRSRGSSTRPRRAGGRARPSQGRPRVRLTASAPAATTGSRTGHADAAPWAEHAAAVSPKWEPASTNAGNSQSEVTASAVQRE